MPHWWCYNPCVAALEAPMSILGGMVDSHHEMELSPSSQLVKSSWFARHFWSILVLCVLALLGLVAA
jgi:hypothetical protein